MPPDLPRDDRDQGRDDAAADIRKWADHVEQEQLRRMADEAQQPEPEAGGDLNGALVEDYLRFLRGQGPEPDLSELPPDRREAVAGQFEIVRALADRDPSLPPLDRDPVARRLGLHQPVDKAQQPAEDPRIALARAGFGPGEGVYGRDPYYAGSDSDEAHPSHHRWYVETYDYLADEWAPGMRFTERTDAVERFKGVSEMRPTWDDGTPVQRRFVRETTTYTVEAATAATHVGGNAEDCPACHGTNPPYPFICPGPDGSPS